MSFQEYLNRYYNDFRLRHIELNHLQVIEILEKSYNILKERGLI